jgi:hypothetical protein
MDGNEEIEIEEKEEEKEDEEGEEKDGKAKILGLFRDINDNIYFKVKEGAKVEIISREKMIKKDTVAILEFYEQHMKFTTAN